MLTQVLTAIVVAGISYAIFIAFQTTSKLPLPPGPSGYPLIGNIPDLLRSVQDGTQHLLFERWARQYGDLYRVNFGPITQYMINSDVAVKAILDTSAAASSERPPWIVANKYLSNHWNIVVSGVNSLWQHQRKVIMGSLGSVSRANEGVLYWEYESLRFLNEVSSSPSMQQDSNQLWRSFLRSIYSATASQMFGLDIPASQHKSIDYIHETAAVKLRSMLPGSYIVEVMPFLEYLPQALKPWATQSIARHKRDLDWSALRMNRVKDLPEAEKSDIVRGSLIYKIMADEEHLGFKSNEQGAYVCLDLVIGSTDTTLMSIWAFVEAMLLYPNIQRKAQKLVDESVSGWVPTWADFERVPYIRCLVKETWRWRSPIGLGIPHVSTQEIVYNGMRIPAGSHLYMNVWTLHHDPNRYKDPDKFLPERFEEDDSTTTMQSINLSDPTKRDHFTFGAGRRVCPGYNVAERALALAIMRVLWAFDVTASPKAKLPLDSSTWRRDIMPWVPGPDMPVVFTPRSAEKVRLISQALEEANAVRIPMRSL